MYIKRLLQLSDIIKNKSYFLFGPRQTGKSTLIKEDLNEYPYYNLLDSSTLLKLSRSPDRLGQEIGQNKVVVIDEIQKLPQLLDEVHKLIEERKVHFLMTGSSARKLRRGGVNLLGGRARTKQLHPFVYKELNEKFDLSKALDIGLIPSIYFSDSPYEDLESYVGAYLKEEIAAEGATRNIPAFSRFLEVAALCNGRMINFTEIANDAQVARTTVHEYFQILKDTLVAREVPAWKKSRMRKAVSTGKIYFFDIGVARYLQYRKGLQAKSPEFGEAFEGYFFHELSTYLDYVGLPEDSLAWWRSISNMEVDFIIGDQLAIEIKAKQNVNRSDYKGLLALKEEKLIKKYVVVCLEDRPRNADGIEIVPWQMFIEKLWGGDYLR